MQKVKSLARVPVVTHIQGRKKRDVRRESDVVPPLRRPTKVVAIGASTGGPKVLDELLPSLPHDYSPASSWSSIWPTVSWRGGSPRCVSAVR